jgi:hypothetical protein
MQHLSAFRGGLLSWEITFMRLLHPGRASLGAGVAGVGRLVG